MRNTLTNSSNPLVNELKSPLTKQGNFWYSTTLFERVKQDWVEWFPPDEGVDLLSKPSGCCK